jgi:hypothetical protein
MSGDKTALPLLRTKLHRPPVARDHLHRQHLLDCSTIAFTGR